MEEYAFGYRQSNIEYSFRAVKDFKDNKRKENSLGKKRRPTTYIKHIL